MSRRLSHGVASFTVSARTPRARNCAANPVACCLLAQKTIVRRRPAHWSHASTGSQQRPFSTSYGGATISHGTR